MKKALIILAVIVLIIGGVLVFMHHKSTNTTPSVATITVKTGDVTEQAQAVGYIKPLHSSTVKSQVDGTVEEIYHDAGDYVKKGEPLLKVKPQPEPADYAQAYEDLQKAVAIEKIAVTSLNRYKYALKTGLITKNYSQYLVARDDYVSAKEKRVLAAQKLALLDKGTTKVGRKTIANIVLAPFSGFILTRDVDVGDPVLSLSSAQASTALFSMANMQDLMFAGSIDEMDAAKIHLNMLATVTIGADPKQKISGKLTKIALQSEQESASTSGAQLDSNLPFNVSFQVQVTKLKIPQNLTLRSGYSATANIKVKTVKDVLVVPERVLHFKGDKTYVLLPALKQGQKPREQDVVIGLSNGMKAEIKKGLTSGEKVLDKPDVEEQ
ncbi:MAG: efflux RND transporter periplasmic adaptor subunit [Gammaproteobacteria bacterium]|nr:efflux RND transporter periplasmic adaptor subunit [Gammaproteobacteria bacterium]